MIWDGKVNNVARAGSTGAARVITRLEGTYVVQTLIHVVMSSLEDVLGMFDDDGDDVDEDSGRGRWVLVNEA